MARRRRRSRTRRARALPLPRSFLQRRSTRWLIAALLTLGLGIGLAYAARLTGGGDEAVSPTPTLAVELPAIEPDPALLVETQVLDVIDGDTIDVRVGGREERVRYYGVDTPERGDRCFGDATDRNEALVGERVLLLSDARERDRFDRLLRYVFTTSSESIDARLIAEGLALAWREDGTYRDELVALEAEARQQDAGCLWSG